jgi:hypothetical protein
MADAICCQMLKEELVVLNTGWTYNINVGNFLLW